LPKCKQEILQPFENIVKICNEYNVELNCFIMLGLPGDTPEDVEFTLNTCLKYGARIRPTIYTPFPNLRDDMTLEQVADFNRQYFPKNYLEPEIAQKYYKLFYDFKGDRPTTVTRNIALKRPTAIV
jgi:anaerobic magnesium-protoporphyrin IX monomethyl ester cyclase